MMKQASLSISCAFRQKVQRCGKLRCTCSSERQNEGDYSNVQSEEQEGV